MDEAFIRYRIVLGLQVLVCVYGLPKMDAVPEKM